MLHVIAKITAKPESIAEMKSLAIALANTSRRDAGCLAYALFQSAEAPHVFQTVEKWSDQASVDAHMKTAHVQSAFANAGPMLATAPEISVWHELS